MVNFSTAIPPVNEQTLITNVLNNEMQRFNNLATDAQTAISLLQERRTALISAAVTGKIDVRNLVNPTIP
ncbi:MAG: hypothetical protein H7Y37_11855 [Anaerolineae bacterium]|nr:hypothetical protein [Gloeobacterales cyanobacterium ES-bin-313]